MTCLRPPPLSSGEDLTVGRDVHLHPTPLPPPSGDLEDQKDRTRKTIPWRWDCRSTSSPLTSGHKNPEYVDLNFKVGYSSPFHLLPSVLTERVSGGDPYLENVRITSFLFHTLHPPDGKDPTMVPGYIRSWTSLSLGWRTGVGGLVYWNSSKVFCHDCHPSPLFSAEVTVSEDDKTSYKSSKRTFLQKGKRIKESCQTFFFKFINIKRGQFINKTIPFFYNVSCETVRPSFGVRCVKNFWSSSTVVCLGLKNRETVSFINRVTLVKRSSIGDETGPGPNDVNECRIEWQVGKW